MNVSNDQFIVSEQINHNVNHGKTKLMRNIALLLLLLIGSATSAQEVVTADTEVETTPKPAILQEYDIHRQAFLDGKQAEHQRFQEKKPLVSYSETFLNKQKDAQAKEQHLLEFERRLNAKVSEQNSELARVQALVDEAQRKVDVEQNKIKTEQNRVAEAREQLNGFLAIRSGLLTSFLPFIGLGAMSLPIVASLGGLGGISTPLYILFFSLWAINIFITLWKKDDSFMRRNKWLMGGALVLFLCMLSAPLFAKNVVEEEAFLSQLELVDSILGQSDFQRYIAILEQKPQKQIDLPAMDIRGTHLKPFRLVTVDTGEYYFTLGALYEHEGRMGDAVAAIKKIKGSSIKIANQNTVLTASIKFLIDHHQMDAASMLLADSLDKLTNVASLVDLALFLDQKGMQASSDDILDRAISIAKDYHDLIRLAQVFYENGSRDKAAGALENAIISTDKTSSLIQLSRLASKMSFPDKSSKSLEKAIATAMTADDSISLSKYAAQINNQEKSVTALQQALEKTRTPDELMRVAETAISGRHDDVIDEINKKVDSLLKLSERMDLIDLYRNNKHMEDAVEVFETLLKTVTKQQDDKQQRLLQYADLAIEREMYEQARNAIERLASLVGSKRSEISVTPNRKLSTLDGVPEMESLELQLYYGLLNEEMDFDDKAESSYTSSVKRTLKSILDSYGYDTPDNTNNFYLLGRIWQGLGESRKLEVLDRVYTDIEGEILKKIRSGYDKELLKLQGEKDKDGYVDLNKEIRRLEKIEAGLNKRAKNDERDIQQSIERLQDKLPLLKQQLPEKQAKLVEYRIYVKQEMKEIVLNNLHAAASTLFLIALIIGCILWAYHKHAKNLSASKTFGFIAKYIETAGWVSMLSVIGVVTGAISVVIGQFLQIYQRSSEELFQLKRLSVQRDDSIIVPVKTTSQELEHENS